MMKLVLFFFAVTLFIGCNKVNTLTEPDHSQNGSLTLKFDKVTIPANVNNITAVLTRSGYQTITRNLNVLSDTSAEIQINSVDQGLWHLKVDAKDINGAVLFTGETDVNVQANFITQVNLTLNPVQGSTGSIYIHVNWGSTFNTSWTDYASNPVLVKSNENYEKYGVSQPRIFYDGSTYRMWYTGLNDNGVGYIGYAVSNDGKSWTRPSPLPVISPGSSPTAWDRSSVTCGPVILENGVYKMFYTGWSRQDSIWSIGVANSTDGITWVKNNTPILSGTSGWEYQIVAASIIKRNGVYYLYYSGRAYMNGAYSYKIGLATSTDGINFTRSNVNPVMSSTFNWEGAGIYSPSIISEGDTLKMVYMSSSPDNAFGKAVSFNGVNWIKDPQPFFNRYKTINGWGSADIAYPWLVKTNNEYRVYYSAYSTYLNIKIGYTRNNTF